MKIIENKINIELVCVTDKKISSNELKTIIKKYCENIGSLDSIEVSNEITKHDI